MTEWSIPGVIDVVTEAVPDREMLVWTSVRRTYREVQDRTRRLAAFLHSKGLGAPRGPKNLERWQCGQSRVAVVLSNCPEYVETMIGVFRARAVPFNVNQQYKAAEIRALLDQIGTDTIVYHRRLGPLLAEAGVDGVVLVDVDDGSGVAPLPHSTGYEDAIAGASGASVSDLPAPSPDDLYLVCTGGTTGRPKGVLWRQADAYVGAMGGTDAATAATISAGAEPGIGVWFAAPPLMHAAAQWTVFANLHNGGTIVLHDDSIPFAARTILETAERERVQMVTIVGDVYARPIIEELQSRTYDLSALRQLSTGGAITSPALKHVLLELLPHLLIIDGYGASETGGMAYGASTKGAQTQRFSGATGAMVLSEDRTRFLADGDEEMGWIARVGPVPLGYLDDQEQTERTFPIVDGVRIVVPGDRGRIAPDGTIELVGRDSMVVNSGGEKIFVEEVEEVVRRHPDVLDVLVVGRPSERFGEEVVALVQLRDGAQVTAADLREFVAASIARFKAPRAVLWCDRIGRHPSGKADYRWAKEAALDSRCGARAVTMDFGFTDEQLALRDAVSALGRQHFPLDAVAEREGVPASDAAWRVLADMGVFALLVPDAPGGAVEAAIAFEQLGAHLASGPYRWTTFAAPLLPDAANGDARLTGVVVDEAAGAPCHVVEHAAESDIVVMIFDRGVARCATSELGRPTGNAPLDPLTPAAAYEELPRGIAIGAIDEAEHIWRAGTVLAAAELVGVAQGALDVAREYALQREQFGVAIGSFQAVKHMLADMYVRVELARSATYAAAALFDSGFPADVDTAARTAKLLAGEAGIANGRTAVQVLGGMGFTWEMLPHYFLKRAWVLEQMFGDGDAHVLASSAALDAEVRPGVASWT